MAYMPAIQSRTLWSLAYGVTKACSSSWRGVGRRLGSLIRLCVRACVGGWGQ
jgi:hypothetical protein